MGGHFNTWKAFFLGLGGGASKLLSSGAGFRPPFKFLLVSSVGADSGGGEITFFWGVGVVLVFKIWLEGLPPILSHFWPRVFLGWSWLEVSFFLFSSIDFGFQASFGGKIFG